MSANRPPRAASVPTADRSRAAILDEATSLATVDGLDGLSIGRLSAAIGMSKSGLYAHFGSKQELQLATVGAAEEVFDREVIEPALAAGPGLSRVRALVEHFFAYMRMYPGAASSPRPAPSWRRGKARCASGSASSPAASWA